MVTEMLSMGVHPDGCCTVVFKDDGGLLYAVSSRENYVELTMPTLRTLEDRVVWEGMIQRAIGSPGPPALYSRRVYFMDDGTVRWKL